MTAFSKLIANYKNAKVCLELATRERFPIGSWWMFAESKTRTQIVAYCSDPDHIAVHPSPYEWDKGADRRAVVPVESLVPEPAKKEEGRHGMTQHRKSPMGLRGKI